MTSEPTDIIMLKTPTTQQSHLEQARGVKGGDSASLNIQKCREELARAALIGDFEGFKLYFFAHPEVVDDKFEGCLHSLSNFFHSP